MSTLINIISGLAALILLTGVVMMRKRHHRAAGSQARRWPSPGRPGAWGTVGFHGLRRPVHVPPDDAAAGGRPPLPPEPAQAEPGKAAAGASPAPALMPGRPPGPERPIAWLKAVRGIALDVILTQSEIVVGRDSGCNLVLDEETVSRKHCALIFRSGQWYVRPFRTPNGTYVNDKPAMPDSLALLKSQDLIRVGPSVVLKITMPKAERVAMKLATGAATFAGSRPGNSDTSRAPPPWGGVADGVAGRSSGDLASAIAIDMLRGMPASLSLSQFMPAVSAAVRARAGSAPDVAGMATTLDAAQLVPLGAGYQVVGVHIGDGHVLVDDGARIRQLTSPHTLGSELFRQGSPGAVRNSERSSLARAIGFAETSEVDTWSEPALAGNRFILTTDGLVNALGFKRLLRSLERVRGDTPQHAADSIIGNARKHFAESAASLDNLTVVVADIVEYEEDDTRQLARPSRHKAAKEA
jgi:serine/threonine protein phosphatase PrpC